MGGSRRRGSNLMAPKPRISGAAAPIVRFRMRITTGDVIAIGPGKIALLEAIDRTGSITSAARHLNMSYRRAWLLLDEINRSLSKPAVVSEKGGRQGGGTALTDTGRRLSQVWEFLDLAQQKRVEARAVVVMVHVLGFLEKANYDVGQRQHHDFDQDFRRPAHQHAPKE